MRSSLQGIRSKLSLPNNLGSRGPGGGGGGVEANFLFGTTPEETTPSHSFSANLFFFAKPLRPDVEVEVTFVRIWVHQKQSTTEGSMVRAGVLDSTRTTYLSTGEWVDRDEAFPGIAQWSALLPVPGIVIPATEQRWFGVEVNGTDRNFTTMSATAGEATYPGCGNGGSGGGGFANPPPRLNTSFSHGYAHPPFLIYGRFL